MKECCDGASRRPRQRGHMELVMHDSGENDQHDADNNRDERKRNDWEFDETESAAEDEKTSGDGENAESMPPDWAAQCGKRPRKNNEPSELVEHANECDEDGTARSQRLIQRFFF